MAFKTKLVKIAYAYGDKDLPKPLLVLRFRKKSI